MAPGPLRWKPTDEPQEPRARRANRRRTVSGEKTQRPHDRVETRSLDRRSRQEMLMDNLPNETSILLRRWQGGDREALDKLLSRDQEWVRARVHHTMGDLLRKRMETGDVVGEAMERVLRRNVLFSVSNKHQFRGLLATLVENTIRDLIDEHKCAKRNVERERPLPQDFVLNFEGRRGIAQERPSEIVQKKEADRWTELAIQHLPTTDRRILELSFWAGNSFEEIASELGMTAAAARRRLDRALPKLVDFAVALQEGRLPEKIKLDEPPDA